MTRLAALSLFAGLLALTPGVAQDKKETPTSPAATKPQRTLYLVKHADAVALAEVIGRHFKGEVEVSPAPAGTARAILISGPPASVPEVVKLLELLDRKPQTIEVEVMLAEVPAADWKDGRAGPEDLIKSGTVQRIKLTATEGQPITSSTGGSKPVTTGEAINPKGFGQRSVTYMPTGTTLKLTARAGAGGAVAVDLDLKDSRVKTEGPAAPSTETVSLTTRLTVPAGKPVAAKAVRNESKDGATVSVVVVTAKVVEPPSGANNR
jgi:type II secretory pathway component GspD/PulD (secretin)